MAQVAPPQGRLVIVLTFVVAMALTIMPLPEWLSPFRPEWLALTLMYWCMALPHRVGVLSGFTLGLLLDVLKGAVLGQHAMALAIMAYLTLKVHQQIRVFPMWQQALSIMGLLILFQMLVMWINGIVDQRGSSWLYWLPTFSSTLLWPWIYLILRDVRRNFGVR